MGSGDTYTASLSGGTLRLGATRPSSTLRHSWQRWRSSFKKSLGKSYRYSGRFLICLPYLLLHHSLVPDTVVHQCHSFLRKCRIMLSSYTDACGPLQTCHS
jgi:hypothetical protein